MTCRITGCERTVVGRGYCLRHLSEARKRNDPSATSNTWDRCPKGHPLTLENRGKALNITPGPSRYDCLICDRERISKRRREQRT
jgi:hypothetical protein